MATLPGIIIKIGAETRDAIQGINKVDKALDRASGRGAKIQAAMKGVGVGLLAVGGAAAAAAVAIGKDMVAAANEDEKRVAKLTKVMQNFGKAAELPGVLDGIDAMQKQYGVAEDQLTPAFIRLLSATNDTDQAMQLLRLSLDLSAASGKSLDMSANALGRAIEGSTGGLAKLGVGLSAADIKAAGLEGTIGILEDRFGGTALKAAETMTGTMDRLGIAIGEVNESAGKGIMDAFMKSIGGSTGDDAIANLSDMEDDAYRVGAAIGAMGSAALKAASDFTIGMQSIPTVWDDFINEISGGVTNVRDWLGNVPLPGGNPLALSDEQAAAMRRAQDAQHARNQQTLASIVNPPRTPAPARNWGSMYGGVSSYSPMRYRANEQAQKKRSRTRAAQVDAKSNGRP